MKETTTVITVTITASLIERSNEPLTSPVRTWVNRSLEPVQREPLHREDQPAADILERQDVDADHRAVEGERHRRRRARPGRRRSRRRPPFRRRTAARGDGRRRHGVAGGRAHRASSLRTSTVLQDQPPRAEDHDGEEDRARRGRRVLQHADVLVEGADHRGRAAAGHHLDDEEVAHHDRDDEDRARAQCRSSTAAGR